MTCEIAIMNQSAVTLAADSAMTVRRWVNGEQQTRYFKGSNKIFQISNHHPVGLMVYGAAGIQNVPWELIVKEFRSHLTNTSYPSLKDYAEALFDYIRQHPKFFPPARRVEIFINEVTNTGLAILTNMATRLNLSAPPANKDERKKVIDDYLNAEIAAISSIPIPKIFPQNADMNALAAYRAKVMESIATAITWAKGTNRLHADRAIDDVLFGKLSVLTLYRKYSMFLSTSGLVIAGFGAMDLYPGYHEYTCYGFLLDDFIFDENSKETITLTQTSDIKAFATTSMVDTFLLGFSQDVYTQVMQQYVIGVKALLEVVKKELNIQTIENIDVHINNAVKAYQEAWTRAVVADHLRPLREVVASLPIDEMANLAETLIMLQSLKEKVTSPTESVGGPIDVAVITKHEGLIWIKRKHYFDPAKNPRYFERQKSND